MYGVRSGSIDSEQKTKLKKMKDLKANLNLKWHIVSWRDIKTVVWGLKVKTERNETQQLLQLNISFQ